jgi:hypothetical protein
VIQAPRACLGRYAGDIERRLARRIPPASGFGRLLGSYVRGLSEALPDIDDAEAGVLIDELFHLLAAQGAAAQAQEAGHDRSQRALLWRAQRYAHEMIADPELDAIAKRLAVAVCGQINTSVKHVESKMPYKAQYTLEVLIELLQQAV